MLSRLAFTLALVSPLAHAAAPRVWVEPSGHRVVRISPDSGGTKFYFHQRQFSADGQKFVFCEGQGISVADISQLPKVSVAQLTPDGGGSANVGMKTREVYYIMDGRLQGTHLDTKTTRVIAELPEAMRRMGDLAINADETLIGGAYVEPKDAPGGQLPPRPPRRQGQRTDLATVMKLKLPRRLFTIDLRSGEQRTFHPSTDWLNHVQFSPTDPALMMFCHEGIWQEVDRIWTLRLGRDEAQLMHRRTLPLEIAGHEFFSPDGQTIWFDLQTPREKEFWLAGVHIQTGALTKYALTRPQWSVHYNISWDGKLFAGDGGGPKSVAKPDNGQFIWLFTPGSDGQLKAEALVDLAQHDYQLEPNVNFTPDNKWIIFQATLFGERHVYAVEVEKTQH